MIVTISIAPIEIIIFVPIILVQIVLVCKVRSWNPVEQFVQFDVPLHALQDCGQAMQVYCVEA